MSEPAPACPPYELDLSHIVTEDDTPVDNSYSEKLMRLLVGSLYSGWPEGRPFVALANVGLFYGLKIPPVVPDVMLSLGVSHPEELWSKEHRSYFVWEFGKPPDLVIEIVSNREGRELDEKLETYSRIGVRYYVVFDPQRLLGDRLVRSFEISGHGYVESLAPKFSAFDLELRLWDGVFEDFEATWLRWYRSDGSLVLLGDEKAEAERQKAEVERQRAEVERDKAELALRRAEAAEAELERLRKSLGE